MVIPHRFRRAGVLIAAAALSISVFAAEEVRTRALPATTERNSQPTNLAELFGFSSANTLLTLNSSFIEPAGSVENEEYSHEDFISALKHRDQMPKTPPEWITKTKDGISAYMTVFQEVGPFNLDVPMRKQFGLKPISGRKNVTAYAPSDPNIIYTASANGGLWKSTDGGETWQPKGDKWPSMYTSCVAVHPLGHRKFIIGRILCTVRCYLS